MFIQSVNIESKCGGLGVRVNKMLDPLRQVSAQPAGRGDGALGRPEAGLRLAEEEAGRAGGEALGQGPDPGQVRRHEVISYNASSQKPKSSPLLPDCLDFPLFLYLP